jgi:arylsulfatase A-like enzyme
MAADDGDRSHDSSTTRTIGGRFVPSNSGELVRLSRTLLALVPILLAACGPRPERRANLVLIVVDSLRQDALGAFGSPIPTSPHIDALAARGVSFEGSYTVTPWTLPSMATILTGLPPSRHGAIDPRKTLAPEAQTLAEILRDVGYRTSAVVSHLFLKARYGMDQGFEQLQDSESRGHGWVSTPGVTRQALEALRALAGQPAPFFLFVHYFDPHYDYLRHPEFGLANVPSSKLKGGETIQELLSLAPTLKADDLEFLRRVYAEEIRKTDQGIGALLREIDALGIDAHTLVVVSADHGEELCDRGDWIGHTTGLYEEDVRVPLVMRDPRSVRPGRVERGPVSIVDLLPTMLDLLGVPVPPDALGESFAATVQRGEAPAPRDVLFEVDFEPLFADNEEKVSHKRAILREGWKLIRDETSGAVELYDLASDPAESRNVAEQRLELRDRLAGDLAEWSQSAAEGQLPAGVVELTARQIERLRSLGYAADR